MEDPPVTHYPHLEAVQQLPNNVSLCTKISHNIGGIICLIILVIDWVVYAEILQAFNTSSFNHLYFIRYCAMSGYMLVIIPWYFINKHSMNSTKLQSLSQIEAIERDSTFETVAGASYKSLTDLRHSMLMTAHEHQTLFQFLRSMLKGTVVISFACFFMGYSWYLSLDYTFVAANTTVYQSQCVFVLIFSYFFLKTKITLMKMIACVIALGGVAMVSFGTTKETDDEVTATWFGYIFCIVSTILYAMQTVSTKYYGDKYFRKNLELADNFLLMSAMGMCAFLFAWPGLIILHITGIETFALPTTYNDIMIVVLPVALEIVFVGSYMAGITLSGPVLMSFGVLSVIPSSFITDVWLHGLDVTMFAVIGSLLIFMSFIVIEIPTKKFIPCIVQAPDK